jgi:hypothetical protein
MKENWKLTQILHNLGRVHVCAQVNGLEYEEVGVEEKLRLIRNNKYYRRYFDVVMRLVQD